MTTASRDLEVSLARRWGTVAGEDEGGRGAPRFSYLTAATSPR